MRPLLILISFYLVTSALAGPKDIPQNSKLRATLIQLALPSIQREEGQAAKLDGPLSRLGDWVFFSGSSVRRWRSFFLRVKVADVLLHSLWPTSQETKSGLSSSVRAPGWRGSMKS